MAPRGLVHPSGQPRYVASGRERPFSCAERKRSEALLAVSHGRSYDSEGRG